MACVIVCISRQDPMEGDPIQYISIIVLVIFIEYIRHTLAVPDIRELCIMLYINNHCCVQVLSHSRIELG